VIDDVIVTDQTPAALLLLALIAPTPTRAGTPTATVTPTVTTTPGPGWTDRHADAWWHQRHDADANTGDTGSDSYANINDADAWQHQRHAADSD
jgi:hypothetical protein